MMVSARNRKLVNQQRLDVQKRLEAARAKTRKQTEELNKLKAAKEAEKTRSLKLMEDQAKFKRLSEEAVLEKHLMKRRIAKETHTLMHDEVLQFHTMAKMIMNK